MKSKIFLSILIVSLLFTPRDVIAQASELDQVKSNVINFHSQGASVENFEDIPRASANLVPNASFENSTSGWYRSGDINPSSFIAINCQINPPCTDGTYHLKFARQDDGIQPLDPYVITDWIETGSNVSGKTFDFSFAILNHNNATNPNPKSISGIALQREPLGGDWSNTSVVVPTVQATTNWEEKNFTLTFPTPANGNSSSRIRIVLRTPNDNWPIYYDKIQVNDSTRIQANGSWADLNYSYPPDLATHYLRTRYIAELAHQQNSTAFAKLAEKALGFIYTYLYPGAPRDSNYWWNYDNGMPHQLGPALLLIENKINSTIYTQSRNTLNYLMDTPVVGNADGVNGITIATGKFFQGLINNNPNRLIEARNMIDVRLIITTEPEGLQADYSYRFHGIISTGAYGFMYGRDIGRYLLWTGNTSYSLPANKKELFANYLLEAMRWALNGAYWDKQIIGRASSQYTDDFKSNALLSILPGALINSSRKTELVQTAKYIMTYIANSDLAPLYRSLATQVQNIPTQSVPHYGLKFYPYSDFFTKHTPDYFFSLRMVSTRTYNADYWGTAVTGYQGKQSWHDADGSLMLSVNNNSEWWSDNTWPTLNHSRKTGTTVEKKTRTLFQGYPAYGNRSFVGGAFTNNSGAAAMDFEAELSCLTVKKSWFIFDEEIVALGSNINCPNSTNLVETFINQWPLSTASTPFIVNGSTQPSTINWQQTLSNVTWAHADGIGYYFPNPQTIKAARLNQSGKWTDLSDLVDDTTVYTNPFLTLWFDHGANPQNKTYQYVLLPKKTAAQTEQYATANPIFVLSNTSALHAVKDNQLNAVGAIFWQAGAVERISVNRPSIVYYQQSGQTITLSASDPAFGTTPFTITYNQRLFPISIPPQMNVTTTSSSTTITVNPSNGTNYVATFSTINTLPSPSPTPQISPTPTPSPIPEDVNSDGVVNATDLKLVIEDYNKSDNRLPTDITKDGIVNHMDSARVLRYLGILGG